MVAQFSILHLDAVSCGTHVRNLDQVLRQQPRFDVQVFFKCTGLGNYNYPNFSTCLSLILMWAYHGGRRLTHSRSRGVDWPDLHSIGLRRPLSQTSASSKGIPGYIFDFKRNSPDPAFGEVLSDLQSSMRAHVSGMTLPSAASRAFMSSCGQVDPSRKQRLGEAAEVE